MSYPLSLFASVNCNLVEKVAHNGAEETKFRAEGFKLTTELWPNEKPDSDESWQASEALLKKSKGSK